MLSVELTVLPTSENVGTMSLRDLTVAVAHLMKRTDPDFAPEIATEAWQDWLAEEQAAGTLPHALATWATDALDDGYLADLDAHILLRWLDAYHAISLSPPSLMTLQEHAQTLDRIIASL